MTLDAPWARNQGHSSAMPCSEQMQLCRTTRSASGEWFRSITGFILTQSAKHSSQTTEDKEAELVGRDPARDETEDTEADEPDLENDLDAEQVRQAAREEKEGRKRERVGCDNLCLNIGSECR